MTLGFGVRIGRKERLHSQVGKSTEEPVWGPRSGGPLDVLSLGCLLRGPHTAAEYTGLGFRADGRAGAGAGVVTSPWLAFEAGACPAVSYSGSLAFSEAAAKAMTDGVLVMGPILYLMAPIHSSRVRWIALSLSIDETQRHREAK